MAVAILHALKQGAYTALALYVAFIVVVLGASTSSSLRVTSSASSSVVAVERVVEPSKGRAS